MIDRREAAYQAVLLAGSAILLGFSLWQLPPDASLFRAPATPFDRNAATALAPNFCLFTAAGSVLPPNASVAALSEPRDAGRETFLHRIAVALLPGRKVFPAALWNVPVPNEQQADFVVVAGGKPSPPPGELLLETPWGTVWKRSLP